MKVLDIVRTKEGLLALVVRVEKFQAGKQCSIEYFKGQDDKDKKKIVAWLGEEDVEVIDSIAKIVQRSVGY